MSWQNAHRAETSEAAIVGIGQSLGRGTIISMLFVLFVLPQILLLGGGLADKTSISMPTAARTHQSRERVFVVGLVTGEISGTVSGLVRASVDGNVNLRVISGRIADGAAVSIPIFLGDFDGQGHKITGLRLTESCSECGLFSRVESGASVRNLSVEGEVIPPGRRRTSAASSARWCPTSRRAFPPADSTSCRLS